MFSRRHVTRKLFAYLAGMTAILGGLFLYNSMAVEAKPTTETPLLVNTRASLRLCAHVNQGLEGKSAAALGRLHASLRILRDTNPAWKQEYGATSSVPILEASCRVKTPSKLLDEYDTTAVGLGLVTNPSPFHTIFLVLDEQTADIVLGDRKVSLAPYEMIQVSDSESVEVTNALVIRESALEDPQVIHEFMATALGLAPLPQFMPKPPTGEKSPTIKPQGHDAED